MGPRSIDRGDPDQPLLLEYVPAGFNGAAIN